MTRSTRDPVSAWADAMASLADAPTLYGVTRTVADDRANGCALHMSSRSGTVPDVGPDVASRLAVVDACIERMRARGVVRLEDRELGVVIDLGPAPVQASDAASAEDATQRSMTLERERVEREQRLRYGASGGPRPAVADR